MLKVSVIGNLGMDAKINTGNFNKFVSFNVAHTSKFQDRQGIEHEDVQWVSCIVNFNADKLLPYLKKGTKVYCHGNLKTRVFTDRGGINRVGLECVVSDIELCGSKLPDNQPQQTVSTNQEVKPEFPFDKNENNDTPY